MRWLLVVWMLMIPLAAQAQDDRGFIQGLLEDALSAEGREVRITGFAGALSRRATIDEITVSDADGIWLRADQAALVWNRAALLRGEIDISEIRVTRIALLRPPLPEPSTLPSAAAQSRFQLPELPVSVQLAELALDRVTLGSGFLGEEVTLQVSGSADLAKGAGRAQLALDRLDAGGRFALDGSFDNQSRVLGLKLDLSEPKGGLAAGLLDLPGLPSVALEMSGTAPIDAYLAELRLETDGSPRLQGQVQLDTSADGQTTASLDIGGDLAPVFAPQYRRFLGPRIDLTARANRQPDGALTLNRLSLSADAITLEGSARIAADGWPERFDLQGQILDPGGEPVLLPLPGDETRLASAQITARFDAAEGSLWTLSSRIAGLERADFSVRDLSLTGGGEIDRNGPHVTGALALNGQSLRVSDVALARALGADLAGDLRFDWQPGAPLSLIDMSLRGADYGLTGDVQLSGFDAGLDPEFAPDVTLQAEDLRRFAALTGLDLSGAATLGIAGTVAPVTGRVSLVLEGTTQDLRSGIARLDPLLEGAGRLDATIARDETGTRLTPLRLRTDEVQIEASGQLGETAGQMALRAELRDVARVEPKLSGALSLDAKATQTGAESWTTSTLFTAPGGTVARFEGTVTGDGQTALGLQGRLTGVVDRLSSFARLLDQPVAGALRLEADGRADLLNGDFSGTANATGTRLRSGIAQLDTLLAGTTRISTQLSRQGARLGIDRMQLDAPGLTSRLSGTLSPQSSRFDVTAELADLARIVPEIPGRAFVSGTARQAQGGPWQLDLQGGGPGRITLQVAGQAASDGARVNLDVSGTAPLELANTQLSPNAVEGLLRFDLAVNGPPALRSVSGRLDTEGARISLPTLRNGISDLTLRAVLRNAAADIRASGRFERGGTMQLRGPVQLDAPYVAGLTAALSNLDLSEPGLFETIANGEVTLTGPLAGGGRIGGRITLEKVEARLPTLGPSYQALEGLKHDQPPRDVLRTLQFAGLAPVPGAAPAAPAPSYPIDLTVAAPNRIFVRGRGLDAELGGEVKLRGTTDALLPEGAFSLIRGRMDLLGRRLTLTEGSLSLRGSFDPVIRLGAGTDVDGTLVTILVEGPASDPQLTIESQPRLPEEEALSLLLFGQVTSNISPLQALQLAQAVRTLSGQGGGVVDQLRQNLRIDDLDIGTNAEGTAQARIGAYVSENVYTDVTVTAEGDSEINLNLDLTDTLTVKGRLGSDGDTGIGLFFEKDY